MEQDGAHTEAPFVAVTKKKLKYIASGRGTNNNATQHTSIFIAATALLQEKSGMYGTGDDGDTKVTGFASG